MNKNLIQNGVLSLATAMFITACGGSGTNSGSSGTSITAVDPYIEGATFFYDANNNGTYDAGELVSTATNASGEASFSETLPDGATVIIKDKGMHNGTPFNGSIQADISSTGVISPLTTLESEHNITKTQIANYLQGCGINISATDIDLDPMADLTLSSTSVNADSLTKIQASVAVNTFLNILGTDTITNATQTGGKLDKACDLIQDSISSSNLGGVNNVDLGVVLKTGVAISDFLVDKSNVDGNTSEIDKFIKDDDSVMTNAISALGSAYSTPANTGNQYTLNADGTITKAVQVAVTYDSFIENNLGSNGDRLWTDISFGNNHSVTWSQGKIILDSHAQSSDETRAEIESKEFSPSVSKGIFEFDIIKHGGQAADESMADAAITLDTTTTLPDDKYAYAVVGIFVDEINICLGYSKNSDPTYDEVISGQCPSVSLGYSTEGKTYKSSLEVLDNGSIRFVVDEKGEGTVFDDTLTFPGVVVEGVNTIVFGAMDDNHTDPDNTIIHLTKSYFE